MTRDPPAMPGPSRALDLSATGGESSERERMRSVYQISALLASFESVERTVPSVLAVVSRTLPLRSAIFVRKTEGRPQTLAWEREGSAARLWAQEQVRRSCAYFGLDLAEGPIETRVLPSALDPSAVASTERTDKAAEGTSLVFPFALADGTIFGALLFECAIHPDELDVMFANAVVNQMSIALDRHDRVALQKVLTESLRAAAEVREMSWRFLADVSSVLASSFDYPTTLADLAVLAVPALGDVCLVDLILEDGSVRRLEALSEFERYAAARELVIAPGLDVPRVDDVAHSSHGEALHAAGLRSMVTLPLLARGNKLGTFTLLSTDRNRYSAAYVAFVEDVARRAALTIDNAQLYERARAAVLAREDLLAIVSHDLRNPLSVIIMLLSALMKETPGEEQTRDDRLHLEAMKRATDRMTRLLADLLDSASMDAGHFSVEPNRVAVAPLVASAIEMARPLAVRGSLRLESDLHGELPAVRADASRIQQVLANLIGNAIKFTPENGKITVSAYRSGGGGSGDTVTFSVKDTGPGIAEADRAHLFHRFWQAQPSARVGTGLGLFIAKAIVESHDGTIWLESAVGSGSTFLFQLPAVPQDNKRAGRTSSA